MASYKANNMKANVISFSGGRTSAYLVHIIEQMRKRGEIDNVHYIFIDTGAEHPKTYEFIKRCVEHFKIDLTCIRSEVQLEPGVGAQYKIIPIEDIKHDLEPWRPMLAKHGTPFNPGGGFCTDRLKTTASDKYCKDTFGDCYKWIGYRADEAKRAWGQGAYAILSSLGFDSMDAAKLMSDCIKSEDVERVIFEATGFVQDMFGEPDERADILVRRVMAQKKRGFRFMFEVTDFEKQDVIDFWASMPFDLGIDEWSGNCVFCIKKGENKVALAAKDNPELADQFEALLEEESVRDVGRRFGQLIMYRGHNSLRTIREKYKDVTRDELVAGLRGSKSMDTGSCSESCEAYSDQMDMLEE